MLRFIPFFLFLSCTGISRAETYTLERAVTQALKRNPELAAARWSIEEARGRFAQSGRLSNPELEAEAQPNVRGREFTFGVGFVQRFPLTNRLRLEKAVSQAEVGAAEAEVKASERKLVAAVRTVGVKWLSLREAKALKTQQIANSKELAATAADLAKRAEGSEIEATQFELEAQQLALEVLLLEAEQATLAGEARPLLGVGMSETVEFAGTLPTVALPAQTTPELSQRPDYQAAQARQEAARQGIALAKAGKWQDAAAGLATSVERAEDAPEGFEAEGFIGLKFSLPLPLWNKNEGAIKEAEATSARLELEVAALAANVRSEAAAALGEMKAARRILDETTQVLLPKARELEDKIRGFYQQAQPGTQFADVLRARERRLALEQARVDALRSYHLARVRHQTAMGL